MPTETYPLALNEELYQQFKDAAKRTGLSVADTIRQSAKLGLPRLIADLDKSGRITNVDPLPDKVLAEIYSRPERDEKGIDALMKAQPKGVRD